MEKYIRPKIEEVPLDMVPELSSMWGGKCAVHRELYEKRNK